MGAKLTVGGSLMHADRKPDFSGYATKAGIRCSDGRTITPDAFKHQDKETVPLVWQHNHSEPENILGHAVLEHREDGVYTYAYFNDTETAANAKKLVEHQDITFLSIYANQLKEKASSVMHGFIREVSLVLAGANPGALIDNISLQHGDDIVTIDDEAVIYTGLVLEHADAPSDKPVDTPPANEDDPTVQEVYDGMTAEQKEVVHYMVGAALEGAGSGDGTAEHTGVTPGGPSNDDKEGIRMSRNAFEQNLGTPAAAAKKHELSHDAIRGIVDDAQRMGSLKEAVEAYALKHGIDNIDLLFPDAKAVTATPDFDKRRTEWVSSVINGTKHSPFSRIKSLVADLTFDDARAKGYIKGSLKKEEFFGLSKRVTTPSTVYKKQKLDRDDIIDITDFDVVAWLKGEMRLMLDEELARAILIGDGREVDDEDKIKDPMGTTEGAGIRSILHDDDLYSATLNVNILDSMSSPSEIVDEIISGMRFYKGSGSPTFYTSMPVLTKMLMAKDTTGRRLYRTTSDLAAELQVANVVTVEVMEAEDNLLGIIVNLQDYTVGADKGGEVSMFDDFDIDYNQYKYLLETRVSGALTKIRSALVVMQTASGDVVVVPAVPTQDDDEVTIVNTSHVVYKVKAFTGAVTYNASPVTVGATVTASYPIVLPDGGRVTVEATPASGYFFENNVEDEWTFSYDA